MNENIIGSLIQNIRKVQELSSKILYNGLCSDAMASMIENGKREGDKLLIDSILQRLGLCTDRFEVILTKEEYELYLKRFEIQTAINNNNFKKAETEIKNYPLLQNNHYKLHKQYLLFQECIIQFKKKAQVEKIRDKILETLSVTIKIIDTKEQEIDLSILKDRRFSLIEFFMLEIYALLFEKSGKKLSAFRWYDSLIRYLDENFYDENEKIKLYPQLSYWICNCYYENGELEQAQFYCEKAISLLKKMKQLSFLPELLHMETKIKDTKIKKQKVSYLDSILESYHPNRKKKEWIPTYKEQFVFSLADVICQRRHLLHLSQEKLASISCSQSTLSKTENAKTITGRKTRNKLLSQLDIMPARYHPTFISTDYKHFNYLEKMDQLIYKNRIEDAKQQLNDLEISYKNNSLYDIQYLKYQKLKIDFILHKLNFEDTVNIIATILDFDKLDIKMMDFSGCQLFDLEQRILVCFIDNCIVLKKYDIVSKLLKQWSIWFIQTTQKKQVIYDKQYSNIIYYYGILLQEKKEYKKADEVFFEGLLLSWKLEDIFSIKKFLYRLIKNIDKIEDKKSEQLYKEKKANYLKQIEVLKSIFKE